MPKTKTIQINITNMIKQNTNIETFKFNEPGKLTNVNNTVYIQFTETSPVKTPVTIKIISNKKIIITRTEQNKLKLILDINKPTTTHYQTPLGIINMTVQTNKLHINLKHGIIFAEYRLYQKNEIIGQYTFNLNFT